MVDPRVFPSFLLPTMVFSWVFNLIWKGKDVNEMNNLLRRQKMSRQKRTVEQEHGEMDLMKIWENKCFDEIPDCKLELCQLRHLALWKKCKKTCGYCE